VDEGHRQFDCGDGAKAEAGFLDFVIADDDAPPVVKRVEQALECANGISRDRAG
jgi:hypothetical protein